MIHHRTKILAVMSCLFCILCIFASGLFIRHVYAQKIVYAEKQLARLTLIEQEKSLDALVGALASTEHDRTFLFERILHESQLIDFIALVETIARERGATLITNSIQVAPIDETFETLVFAIDVTGTYTNIVSLLHTFEQLPYQVDFQKIRLIRGIYADGSEWKISFELRVTKYKKI